MLGLVGGWPSSYARAEPFRSTAEIDALDKCMHIVYTRVRRLKT